MRTSNLDKVLDQGTGRTASRRPKSSSGTLMPG
jgi:hypothetical protein